MIKASKFSLSCGLFNDGGKLSEPKMVSQEHSRLEFVNGDPTAYGHAQLKMTEEGHAIIRKAILNPKNHSYTGSNGSLPARQAVAKHYGGGLEHITANDVIITHGANMGLFIALMSITNPGDNVLVPEPGYPFFHRTGPSVGVEARGYKLNPTRGFEIDLVHLAGLVDSRTRFLWIVNPSNPCGAVFSEAHMTEIMDFCKAKNIFIIADEVYWNESFESRRFTSFGHLSGEDVPIITIGGIEKTLLVPGWGISWMIFNDPHKKLADIKRACLTSCQIFLHPCSFLMAALPELLDTLTADFSKNCMPIFEKNHDELYAQLSRIQGLVPIPAQGTFYLSVIIDLAKFDGFTSDLQFLQSLFDEENVKIMNLSAFQGNLHGFRMLTCATSELNQQLVKRIQHFCERHRKSDDSEDLGTCLR